VIDSYEPAQPYVTPEHALDALAKAPDLSNKSTPEYSQIIREHERAERHYTMTDAERMSGGMDCRAMSPTSVRPDCGFLACQIGKCYTKYGETIFLLLAFGETWNEALHMLGRRGAVA
jgi:hypothetical protein